MKTTLDFIIIGAQKSGTTTLFELLKQHNEIYLPPEKEAPFFGKTDREEKGWDWYLNEFFSTANETLQWGSITPQYMAYSKVAEKIYLMNPQIKLIAILRDPYERAYSHYVMSRRRNYDTREFIDAIKELSSEKALEESRNISTEINSYIVRGEYGRILYEYKKIFGAKNLLILFINELENDPQKTLDRICNFLNIKRFKPEGIGTKFYVGGGAQKNKSVTLLLTKIKGNNSLKWLVKKVVPFKSRRRLWAQIDQWNIEQKEDDDINEIKNIEESKKYLKSIYDADALIFEKEFNQAFPWHKA